MKHLIGLILFLLFCTPNFANNFQLKEAMRSIWESQKTQHMQLDKNDVLMVYGGEDISLRPSIVSTKEIA